MSNKRTSLPLWKKYDIVNEVNRNDTPVSMLAKELEILRTSLITILKNKVFLFFISIFILLTRRKATEALYIG